MFSASSTFMVKYNLQFIQELSKIGDLRITLIKDKKNRIEFSNLEYDVINIESLDYHLGSSNPAAYEHIYESAELGKVDTLFLPRLMHPELLYNEIEANKRKILTYFSIFGLELYNLSNARNILMNQLLNHKSIGKILLHTIASSLAMPHPDILKIFNHEKVIHTNDPIYENPSIFELDKGTSREKLCLPINKKILLFFGSPFYSKGLDIAIRAMEHLSDEFNLLIGSNLRNSNYKVPEILNNPKVTIHDRFISESEMPLFFSSSDIVLLPYRKSYEHGTSGVLIQSMLAEKPVIVPNFSPFKQLIEEFGIGECFCSEDSAELANSIVKLSEKSVKAYEINVQIYKNLKIDTWDKIVHKLIFEKA